MKNEKNRFSRTNERLDSISTFLGTITVYETTFFYSVVYASARLWYLKENKWLQSVLIQSSNFFVVNLAYLPTNAP
jgi:hypothetical protein